MLGRRVFVHATCRALSSPLCRLPGASRVAPTVLGAPTAQSFRWCGSAADGAEASSTADPQSEQHQQEHPRSSRPTKHARSAVGRYRPSYFGDADLHLRECLPTTTSASSIPTKKRADLTTLLRRYRDVDQSDSMIRRAKAVLDSIDPAEDVAADADFACLCLNAHHTFRLAPPDALLSHVVGQTVPRIKTTQQLEIVVSAFHDMAGRERSRELLSELVPLLEPLTGTMRKEAVVLVASRLVDAGVCPVTLMQALQERAVMLVATMSFHELSQLCLALAGAPQRPEDVADVFESDFAPQLLKKVDFATAQDLASAMYAYAEVGVAVPELVAQCASRLYALHHELDADGVAMTFSALALMELRAPKLTKALVALTKELDLSTVTALAALDMGHAMAALGVRDDTVLSMLTGRIMADRKAVLASPEARQRLVELSARLSDAAAEQDGHR